LAVRFKKVHPALKHAAYSATTLLPGEDPVALEKLHRALIAELIPVGALEEDIVTQIAHLMWRKQNLASFRIARRATDRFEQIKRKKMPELERVVLSVNIFEKELVLDPQYEAQQRAEQEARWRAEQEREECEEEARRQRYRDAEEQGRQELGDAFELVVIGKPATIEGLTQELDVKDRLDASISKCLKQLLMVRGIKSLASNSSSTEIPELERPRKAGCGLSTTRLKKRDNNDIGSQRSEAGSEPASRTCTRREVEFLPDSGHAVPKSAKR
jgi:hypothetical protein